MLTVDIQHQRGDFRLDTQFEAPNGITVLFGKSGSGKSTVVNAVAGLLQPDQGHIVFNGTVLLDKDHCVPAHRRRFGYVFQDDRLFPHMSVRQNLMFGARFTPKDAPPQKPSEIADLLGIGHLLDRQPKDLSGGEKQRVAIGRALLTSPQMLLADEPLSSLDMARKHEILTYFERLRDVLAIPMLYVTHAPTEVARLATKVIVLQEGKVIAQGTAAEVLGNPDLAPAGIRSVGAVLHAHVVAHHTDGLTELDAGGCRIFLPRTETNIGQNLRVRIAAQDVILSRKRPEGLSALNIINGTILSIRQGEGPGAIVSLTTPAGTVLARITQRSAQVMGLAPGMTCHAILKSVAIAPQDVGH